MLSTINILNEQLEAVIQQRNKVLELRILLEKQIEILQKVIKKTEDTDKFEFVGGS